MSEEENIRESVNQIFSKNMKMTKEHQEKLNSYFKEISLKSADALKIKIESIEQVHDIFKNLLLFEKKSFRNQEHFWVMGLDDDMFLSCIYIAAFGSLDYKTFHKKASQIFEIAKQKEASRIILVHYIPEGSIEPTEAEVNLVNSFYHFNRLFFVAIVDHLIMNFLDFYSFAKNKILEKIDLDITHKIVYEARYDIVKDRIIFGEEKKQEGVQEGLKKGFKNGTKEGRLLGIEEVAKKMLLAHEDISVIMKYTGLSEDEIKKLQ